MKIRDLRLRKAQYVAEMKALVGKADDADVPMADADATAFDDLAKKVEALDARISKLEQVEAAEATAAAATDEDEDEQKAAPYRATVPATVARAAAPAEKGLRAARYLIGAHAAKSIGNRAAAALIENKFGDNVVAKALSQSGGASSGGVLIPTSFSNDLIEMLRPLVAVRAAGPVSMSLDTGNLTIPKLASGSNSTWSGEITDIGVSQQTFGSLVLSAKKLSTIVPVSNDLLRRSPVGLDAIIRDDLLQSIARKEDLAFLRGDGANGSPTGLTAQTGVTKLTAAAADATAVTNFLMGIVVQAQVNLSRMIRPVWIMSPVQKAFIASIRDGVGSFLFKQELDAGKLLGYPVQVTQQLPQNLTTAGGTHGAEIMFADFADVIVADTLAVQVDVSAEAAFFDGTAVQSAFSKDMTLFRVLTETDLGLRHPESVIIGQVDGWKLV